MAASHRFGTEDALAFGSAAFACWRSIDSSM